MDVVRIRGGNPLRGTVKISGAKNAALPIFAATLLTEDPCIIENVPDLSDIRFMGQLLAHLGAEVERLDAHTWRITAREIAHTAPYDLMRKMRASVCLMGPLVGRLKRSTTSLPGGCVIGPRPIDLHLKGFAKMGCAIDISEGYVKMDGSRMRGGDVFLGGRHGSTVLGTANILMAATLTPGVTRIDSAACEPEIVDLCHMLVAMGAQIEGIGSHALVVEGVDRLYGCTHRIIPDRIEAGTFILGAAMTRGDVTIQGARFDHLTSFFDKLEEAGLHLTRNGSDSIQVNMDGVTLSPVDVITLPHPGFATDLQAQICALMAITPGLSIVTEKIYPHRFMHVPELQRMGADIAMEGASAIIKGVPSLSGAPVMASDLRASAALFLAGLAAEGETWVQRVYHIDRGYERIDEKLRLLGADITRMPESEMPRQFLDEPMAEPAKA
jgi:UDP-N-acetylglucosamine 1-carboxyvinyltransferase